MLFKINKREEKRKTRISTKIFRALAIFLSIFCLTATINYYSEYQSYKSYYEDQIKKAYESLDSVYAIDQDSVEAFKSTGVISDEEGLLNSDTRQEVISSFEEIYDILGVQMFFKIVNPSVSDGLNVDQRETYSKDYFDSLCQTSETGGSNYCLLMVYNSDTSPSYNLLYGPEAKKALTPYKDDVFDLGYMMDNLSDPDENVNNYASYSLASYYRDLANASRDPETYFTSNLKYSKMGMDDDFRAFIICLFFTILPLIYLVISLLSDSYKLGIKTREDAEEELKKKARSLEERDEYLKRSLESFAVPGELSPLEDVDNEENPLHDLVEKYGGFDQDEVLSEEESKTGNSTGL